MFTRKKKCPRFRNANPSAHQKKKTAESNIHFHAIYNKNKQNETNGENMTLNIVRAFFCRVVSCRVFVCDSKLLIVCSKCLSTIEHRASPSRCCCSPFFFFLVVVINSMETNLFILFFFFLRTFPLHYILSEN